MRFDPAEWARVHDEERARDLVFRRGIELCLELCGGLIRPGEPWADLGCGTGHLAAALAARGARVLGIDHDPRMTAYARRRWQLPVAVGDAGALPLAGSCCAGVVAVSLLGCLPDAGPLLAEAARVLAPGGTLCFTAMNRHSLLLAASRVLGWRRRGREGSYAAYDPSVVAARLRELGLIPERQVLYSLHLTAGDRLVPPTDSARRWQRSVPPGTRSFAARQIVFLARRSGGIPAGPR
jgi:SAM-dependent methyltransferase